MKEKIHQNLVKTEQLLNKIKSADTLEYTNWIIEKTKIKYTKNFPLFLYITILYIGVI